MTICSVDGCEKRIQGRGLCPTHYMRLRRTGSVELGNARVEGDVVSRFHRKYTVMDDGCWLWRNSGLTRGYGALTIEGGEQVKAHRWSYEHHKGPIPEGMQIDHTCHNRDKTCAGGVTCRHRRCVNPDHLEAVDNRTNFSRSKNHYINRPGCKRGHPWNEENTIWYRGTRWCRACREANNRRGSIRRAELRKRAREAS